MDNQLFEEFFLKNEEKLWQYCLYLTHNNSAEAEDLFQETFLRFLKQFFGQQRIQDVKEVPLRYLKVTAERIQIEWWRKSNKDKHTVQIDECHEAQLITDKTNLNSQVDFEELRRNCYLKLNQFERSIFFASHIDGYSLREIAKRFSVSERVVRYRLEQAMNKLQSQ